MHLRPDSYITQWDARVCKDSRAVDVFLLPSMAACGMRCHHTLSGVGAVQVAALSCVAVDVQGGATSIATRSESVMAMFCRQIEARGNAGRGCACGPERSPCAHVMDHGPQVLTDFEVGDEVAPSTPRPWRNRSMQVHCVDIQLYMHSVPLRMRQLARICVRNRGGR